MLQAPSQGRIARHRERETRDGGKNAAPIENVANYREGCPLLCHAKPPVQPMSLIEISLLFFNNFFMAHEKFLKTGKGAVSFGLSGGKLWDVDFPFACARCVEEYVPSRGSPMRPSGRPRLIKNL
jgi:hypothetical protein